MRRAPLVGLWLTVALACGRPDPDAPPLTVTVPPGATWSVAVDSLTARGIVRSRLLFTAAARLRGVPDNLKSGVYAFRPGEHFRIIFDALTTGRGVEQRLVVPEGLMLREVAALVEDELSIPADSFIAAATDPALLARLEIPAASLEGYLYPETYHVPVGVTAASLARLMTDEFETRWKPSWTRRLDTIGLTAHEIVILASIVEGEARHADDRPLVSGVYHNRLKRGMPLQADPTVIYALGERRRLFEVDYQVDHPYNTYQFRGLPPGPIGNPGEASMAAALYPADVPYLYFVARPDGTHMFSRTLAEHEQARRQVRDLWRAQRQRPAGAGERPPGDRPRR